MFRRYFPRRASLRPILVVSFSTLALLFAHGQEPDTQGEQKLVERFETILLRSPRRGTALDRVYGYYAQTGRLDELVQRYESNTKAAPTDAKSWMVLGLIEAKRGNDANAIKAFARAEAADTNLPLASYYLGQSLLLVGKSTDAITAIERAIKKQPGRADLLVMYQTLGRIHQRAHRNAEALAVWNRLEQQFPGDTRVAEQIATALAEEEQFAEALKRYQALAERTTDDPYRRVIYRIEAANMTLRMGNKQDALEQFENLLANLKPESWLHQQVRSRIEGVYRQADDLAGLATYYETWLEKRPDDLGAMTRLASALATLGRGAEARTWFDQAIELAPSRVDIRQALIDQLVYEKQYRAAISQYEALDRADPNNPDYVRQWGLLVLRDKSLDEAPRKAEAVKVWTRLSKARPEDPVTATQVADLLRRADAFDEAEKLYLKAVYLNPHEPQYREYLGEFYHDRDAQDKALAAWQQIAEPPRRDAESLHRLAEVLSGFGYDEPAITAAAAACELAPDDFAKHITYVDLLADNGQFQDILPILDRMKAFAENLEQHEAVLDRQITALQGADLLDGALDNLQSELAAGTNPSAERWRILGRYYEAKRELPKAIEATQQAIQIDKQSVAAYRLMARLHESAGEMGQAANDNRRLAIIDPQFKTTYLTAVANLEARLGRSDEALAAGRELIAAAPGNPEHYQFFASLCFQLGKNDEGLATLRRAVRANPSDLEQLMNLGSALAEQFRNSEAIELYWQAFDKAVEIDDQVNIVTTLTELYLNQNQLDTLLERLERMRRETDQDRALTFCVAAAHLAAQDFGAARSELSVYLAENDRDTDLLNQIAIIAEREGDLEGAIQYRSRLNQIAPNEQSRRKLAQLFLQTDQGDEAEQLLATLAMEQDQRHRILKSVDELLAYDRFAGAQTITASLLRDRPDDWEAIYREGVSAAKQDKHEVARKSFERILEIATADHELSAAEKEREKNSEKKKTSTRTYYAPWAGRNSRLSSRVGNMYQILSAIGLGGNYYAYSSSRQRTIWVPTDAGQARLAAIGWLLKLADGDEEQTSALKTRFAPPADLSNETNAVLNNKRQLYDALYLAALLQVSQTQYKVAKALSHDGTVESQAYYLSQLSMRGHQQRRRASEEDIEPLADDELDHMVACYRNVLKSEPRLQYMLSSVLIELQRADRTDQESELYVDAINRIKDAQTALMLLNVTARRGDYDKTIELMDVVERLSSANPQNLRYATSQISRSLMYLTWKLKENDEQQKTFDLLERYWQLAKTIRDRLPTYLSRQRRPNRGRVNFGVQIYKPNNTNYVQLNFPVPSRQFDEGDIGLLRNVYAVFLEDEDTETLLAALQQRLDNAPDDSSFESLHKSIAAVHWWNEGRDGAVESLEALARQYPGRMDLKFSLVNVYGQTGDLEQALETLESIEAFDQASVMQRENMTLNLAVQLGDIDRARQAAEYLFGVRLTSNEQISLAQQMHQIGLHELAEAVLRRARKRSVGNRDQMLAIMNSYAQQGKMDIAVQVAQQVLRRPAASSSRNRSRSRSNRDPVREQALRLLSQSGQLAKIIERTEEQLQRSPKSTRIIKMLAEYYQAANQPEKSRELYLRLAELLPNDGKARYQIAETFRASGDIDAALEQYLAAFRADANLYDNNYYQIQRLFRDKKRLHELAKAFLDADLSNFRSPYRMRDIVRYLLPEDEHRELGMDLFAKVWKEHPNYRYYFVNALDRSGGNEVYQDPRIFKYAKETFFGTTPNYANIHPSWQAMSMIHSWSRDKVNSSVTTLLDAANAQDKYSEVRAEIDKRLAKDPQWHSGIALRALIDLREGKPDSAKPALEELLADEKSPPGSNACMVIGQEVTQHDELTDFAERLYEHATDPNHDDQPGIDFEYGPGKRLLEVYKKQENKTKALALLRKVAQSPSSNQHDPQYAAYQLLQRQIGIGKEFMELDSPLDALRTYRRITPNTIQAASRFGGSYYREQFDEGFAKAKGALKANLIFDDLVATFSVQPQEPANVADSEVSSVNEAQDKHKTKDKRHAEGQVALVEYLLAVETNGERAGTITSPIAAAIEQSEPDDAKLAELQAALAAWDQDDDFSSAVLRVIVECKIGDDQSIKQAIDSLQQMLQREPLTPITKKRASTRQRRVAKNRIVVWLAARSALQHEQFADIGTELAELAVEAARRQLDPSFAAAMLQQLGMLALERDDRQAAEDYWRQMLSVLVGRELAAADSESSPGLVDPMDDSNKKTSGRAIRSFTAPIPLLANVRMLGAWSVTSQVTGTVQAVPVLAASPATQPAWRGRKGIRPVTTTAFDAAIKLSKLAIENEMAELSLQCVRETLRGGPPIKLQNNNESGQFFVMSSNAWTSPSDGSGVTTDTRRVYTALTEMSRLWQKNSIPPRDVYEVYREIVLPPARPGEVFLFENQLQLTSKPYVVSSLSRHLAEAAVRAETVSELRADLEQRGHKPLAKLPALIAEAHLAQATGDTNYALDVLERLAERVQSDTQLHTCQLACHAGVPFLKQSETRAQARALLSRVAENARTGPDNSSLAHDLGMLLAHAARSDGNVADANQRLEKLRQIASQAYVQTNNSQSYYRRLLEIGTEYARLGQIEPALDLLGHAEDLSPNQSASSDYSVGKLLTHIRAQLEQMPVDQRYDLLHQWIMPSQNRRTVRLGSSTISAQYAPHLVDDGQPPDYRPEDPTNRDANWMSLLEQLIVDARELNTFDDLRREIDQLKAAKVDSADTLAMLTSLDNADPLPHPQVNELIQDFIKRSQEARRVPIDFHLLNRQLFRIPHHRAAANTVFANLSHESRSKHYSTDLMHMRLHRLNALIETAGVTFDQMDADQLLEHWCAGRFLSSSSTQQLQIPSSWMVYDDILTYVTGSKYQRMFFRYPLSGNFEFSALVYDDTWSEGSLAYAGILIEPEDWNNRSKLSDAGNHNKAYRAWTPTRRSGLNLWTVRVQDNTVSFLIGNRIVHRQSLAGNTSPWIAFCTEGARKAYFVAPELEGEIDIPREVSLISDGRMDGWVAKYYGETIPVQIQPLKPDEQSDDRGSPSVSFDPTAHDWSVHQDILYGRQVDASERTQPSRLVYHRPLQPGETIRYEYFYSADEVDVAAGLGRLAFRFQPDGVRVHWMKHRSVADLSDLAESHWITPNVANLLTELAVKEDDWNSVKMRLENDSLHIDLNGQLVGAFPVTSDQQFSFFHFKDQTESRIRNVVLEGEWPEALDDSIRSDLFAHRKPPSAAESVVAEMIDDKLYELRIDDLVAKTAQLPDEQRYDALADWVLPSARNPGFRIFGSPQRWMPQPLKAAGTKERESVRDFFALPAVELVETAKNLDRLPDLAQRVTEIQPLVPVDASARVVLQAMIAAAAGDSQAGKIHLRNLNDRVMAADPMRPYHDRWPELHAMLLAVEHPELADTVEPLVDELGSTIWKNDSFFSPWNSGFHGQSGRRAFDRIFRLLKTAMSTEPFVIANKPTNVLATRDQPWTVLSHPEASSAGLGSPPSIWTLRGESTLIQRSGHMFDNVMYSVPLMGEFEFRCQTRGWGGDQVRVGYAGKILRIATSGKNLYVNDYHARPNTISIDPPVKDPKDWYHLTLKVSNGRCSFHMNDQQLYEWELPDSYDAWLFFNARPDSHPRIRNLALTGNPTIPDSFSVSPTSDLYNWIRYYSDRVTKDLVTWKFADGELQAEKFDETPECDFEHLLCYHRPLLEDGAIEYEFYFEPGKALVHPALGRLAMLLEPKRVAEHWITDAQFETSTLAPGNRTIIPSDQRSKGELRLLEKQWNKLRLELTGDIVSLHLNDTLIYERELPRSAQRTFGLFHFADRTAARVRNIRYSGNWPKALGTE